MISWETVFIAGPCPFIIKAWKKGDPKKQITQVSCDCDWYQEGSRHVHFTPEGYVIASGENWK